MNKSVRGYIRGNPVAILMAYVVGLFCCYVPGSLVMVPMYDIFSLDLVLGGIFVVIPWQF